MRINNNLMRPCSTPDDVAIEQFADAMRKKMARKSKEGREGWQNCSERSLARMLIEHIEKGDPVDIANFAMMLWHNKAHRSAIPKELRKYALTDAALTLKGMINNG